jgi:hypothetical protein
MWRDAHVLTNIEQKCTYLRVLLTGFVHDCSLEEPTPGQPTNIKALFKAW